MHEDWGFMSEQKSPEEIAYSLVHYSCNKSNPKFGDILVPFNSEYFKMILIKKISEAIRAERSTRNTCKNCRKDPCVKKDQQNYIHESTSNVVDSKQAFPSNEEIKAFKNSFIRVNDPVKETLKQLTINATVEFFDNWFKKHGS